MAIIIYRIIKIVFIKCVIITYYSTSFGFLTWENTDGNTTGYMECSAFIQQSSGSPACNLNKNHLIL